MSKMMIFISILSIAIALVAWMWLRRYSHRRAKRKGMFRFNDGLHIRDVDPIAVIISLKEHPDFRFDIHPQQARNGNQTAIATCVDAISKAFGVAQFVSANRPGLTTVEMIALLDAFEAFCMRLKKNS